MIGVLSVSSSIHDLGQTTVNAKQPASDFSVCDQLELVKSSSVKVQLIDDTLRAY